MEWIIESYDRRTDRDGENRYTTENAFISAAEDLTSQHVERIRVRHVARRQGSR